MLKITTQGESLLRRKLSDIEKRQLPFALSLALNKTAQDVKDAEVEAMRTDFDRPTRFTLNSLFIRPARKNRLEAKVWVKDYASKAKAPTEWLVPEVMGGARGYKRSEGLLFNRGILPSGKAIAPGRDMKLNGHGNVSRGTMQKILSGLGAQHDKASNSTDSRRSAGNRKRYFVLGKGASALGIAERSGKGKVGILLAFIAKPSYSSAFDFFGIADRVVHEQLPDRLEQALAVAMASRK